MAFRKHNPSLATILLVGTGVALAVGGAAYAIVGAGKQKQKQKKKKKKKKKIRCADGYVTETVKGTQICVPTPEIQETPEPKGQYVGAPGFTQWPHQDAYPTERSWVLALVSLGYHPGNSLTSAGGKKAVREFQANFNVISSRLETWLWPLVAYEPLDLGQLREDGLLGRKTIEALVTAVRMVGAAEMSWQELLHFQKSDFPDSDVDIEDEDLILLEGDAPILLPTPQHPPRVSAQCRTTIRDALREYLSGGGTAEGAVEYILDTCHVQHPADVRLAVLDYIVDTAELNAAIPQMGAVRDYAIAAQ